MKNFKQEADSLCYIVKEKSHYYLEKPNSISIWVFSPDREFDPLATI